MIDEYAAQRQLPLDEATYGKCGVTRWRRCPNCGKPVEVTTSRCGWCGQHLLRDKEPGKYTGSDSPRSS